MATHWATNLLHFHLNMLFLNMARTLYCGIIWHGNSFGYFSKTLAIFSNLLVTLVTNPLSQWGPVKELLSETS
jgi:hypothetical protein